MALERVIISPDHLQALVQEAEEAFPRESCGLLFGKKTEASWLLLQLRPMRNISPQPEAGFEFDNREQLSAMREADAAGYEILGHYHSHPNGRRGPSPTDLQLARTRLDNGLWLIVAVAAKKWIDTSAWQLRGEPGEFVRITFFENTVDQKFMEH